MDKTITIATAVIISSVLARQGSKLTKLAGSDKLAVTDALTALRPVRDKYLKDEKETQEILRPENWDELVAMASPERWEQLSDEERKAHNRAVFDYQFEVDKALREERDKVVTIEVKPLDDEKCAQLLDSNPEWSVDEAAIIRNFFSA